MDFFANQLIQFYANNATNHHHWTSHSTPCCTCTQHGDRIVTTDYCDVTSPATYIYAHMFKLRHISYSIKDHICFT